MLPLDLTAIGAAWYAGNLHKWVCAPKGAGFLHVRPDRQEGVRPPTISHGANAPIGAGGHLSRYRAEFDWQGTLDPTPWLSVPAALAYVGGLLDGGWPAVMARNHALTLEARDAVGAALGLGAGLPAPESMLGSMVALPLPETGPLALAAAGSSPLDTDPLQRRLLDEFRIEVPITSWPVPAAEPPDGPRRLIRISSALHNGPDDAERLAAALAQLATADRVDKRGDRLEPAARAASTAAGPAAAEPAATATGSGRRGRVPDRPEGRHHPAEVRHRGAREGAAAAAARAGEVAARESVPAGAGRVPRRDPRRAGRDPAVALILEAPLEDVLDLGVEPEGRAPDDDLVGRLEPGQARLRDDLVHRPGLLHRLLQRPPVGGEHRPDHRSGERDRRHHLADHDREDAGGEQRATDEESAR